MTTPSPQAPGAQVIVAAILGARYSYAAETNLQDGVAQALAAAGITATREHSLTPHDRVDLLAGRVAIEVKLSGPVGDVRRQLTRYANSPDVDELILVTTRAAHRGLPATLNGKPVWLAWLSRTSLSGGW